MKVLRSIKIFVALILTLTCIAVAPIQTVAAADEGNYVSEVYVAYGKNADEAKKTLEDKGFTPVDGNLNDGGKTYAMLGYKTTSDPQEGRQDLRYAGLQDHKRSPRGDNRSLGYEYERRLQRDRL